MTNVTLAIPEDLRTELRKHEEVNWSAVIRKALQEHLLKIRISESIASQSQLNEKDAEEISNKIKEDIANIEKVRGYCAKRIFAGESTPSKEKIISLSDKDAAYIQKGNREATIGYKPQLGRSNNGFVSTLIIPLGNAADSDQLEPTIEDSVGRTKIMPDTISTDDGYVNQKTILHH